MALIASAIFADAQSNLVIVHNCPDPAAATVDVWIRVPSLTLNQKAIADFPFRNYFVYAVPMLPPNTAVEVDIKGPNSMAGDAAIYTKSFPTGVPSGNYVIQAVGLVNAGLKNVNSNDSFQLAVYPAQLGATAGNANVSVYHGSPDAPNVTTQAFITTIQSLKRDTLTDNLAFASSTAYAQIPASGKRLHVYATGTTTPAYQANADVLKSLSTKATHVFASGFLDTTGTNGGKGFGLFAVVTDASTAASTGSGAPMAELPKEKVAGLVQVYHNAADPAVKSVDLYVGKIKQQLGLKFREGFQSAGFIQDFDYVIDLHRKDSATSILNTTLRFDSDSVVAVVSGVLDTVGFKANPNGVSKKLNFFIKKPVRVTQPAGATQVTVFHGATDAPIISLTAPALGGAALITNQKYGEFQVANVAGVGTSLPTSLGNVVVDLKIPGGATYKSYIVPLGAIDGKAVTVCASGFLDSVGNKNGPNFRIFVGLPSAPFPQIVFLKDTAIISSITDPAKSDLQFRMFPNPAVNELTFGFDVTETNNVSIDILDLNGRVVQNVINSTFSNESYFDKVDIRDLQGGLYIARVKSDAKTSSYKFNVVR